MGSTSEGRDLAVTSGWNNSLSSWPSGGFSPYVDRSVQRLAGPIRIEWWASADEPAQQIVTHCSSEDLIGLEPGKKLFYLSWRWLAAPLREFAPAAYSCVALLVVHDPIDTMPRICVPRVPLGHFDESL